MGLGIAFQRSIAQTNASRNDAVAMTLASGIVDNLESRPFEDWDTNSALEPIAKDFYADFEGNYLVGGPDDAYFKPTITILEDFSTHRDIRIVVDWSHVGGLEEQQRAGLADTSTVYTFAMDVTIAQTYGESIFDAGGP